MTGAALSRPGLRVAMVIQRFRPHFSGQGQQLELLCRALVKRAVQPTVITSAYDQPTAEEQVDGYRVVRLRSDVLGHGVSGVRQRIRGPALAVSTFGALSRSGPFDLVHVHALTDALYATWAWCRLRRRPVLFEMTLLGVDDAITALESPHRLAPLRHAMFRRCDGYAAISPALERCYHEAGLPADRIRLLPQGVDVEEFRPGVAPDVRRELGVPNESPMIIFVGSLIRRKGVDILLRAWSELSERFPNIHLVLVGRSTAPPSDPEPGFWAEQLATLPAAASARLHTTDVRRDVRRLLQAADVFVFPSRREGFGTVMIEAMACGLPCVVTEQPGITDFIFGADGRTGTVIPQEDHRRLAAAVSGLLADPVAAGQMGARARDRVVSAFNIDRIADRYMDFYHALIDRERADS